MRSFRSSQTASINVKNLTFSPRVAWFFFTVDAEHERHSSLNIMAISIDPLHRFHQDLGWLLHKKDLVFAVPNQVALEDFLVNEPWLWADNDVSLRWSTYCRNPVEKRQDWNDCLFNQLFFWKLAFSLFRLTFRCVKSHVFHVFHHPFSSHHFQSAVRPRVQSPCSMLGTASKCSRPDSCKVRRPKVSWFRNWIKSGELVNFFHIFSKFQTEFDVFLFFCYSSFFVPPICNLYMSNARDFLHGCGVVILVEQLLLLHRNHFGVRALQFLKLHKKLCLVHLLF